MNLGPNAALPAGPGGPSQVHATRRAAFFLVLAGKSLHPAGVGTCFKIYFQIGEKYKFKLVPWLREAHGSSGDTVYREVNGETIVGARPGKRKTPSSPRQVAVQKRLAQASDYADMVLLNPPLRALYEPVAEETEKSVYVLARDDWWDAAEVSFGNASLLTYEGRPGDIIRFTIRDLVAVDRVIVTLSDADEGTLIEKGQGVPEVAGSTYWMYTATQAVPAGVTVTVRVEAFDHPGNVDQESGSKKITQ